MSQEPEVLALVRGLVVAGAVPFARVFGDGLRDRVVEALVQGAKIIGADRGVHFECQVGHRLTDVAVIAHDLRHGEPPKKKIVPVKNRGSGNLRARPQPEAQCLGQLVQEQRHSVIDLGLGRRWSRPHCHFRPAPADDFVAVHTDEFVERDSSHYRMLCRASAAGPFQREHLPVTRGGVSFSQSVRTFSWHVGQML
jgi:hypothetical protein